MCSSRVVILLLLSTGNKKDDTEKKHIDQRANGQICYFLLVADEYVRRVHLHSTDQLRTWLAKGRPRFCAMLEDVLHTINVQTKTVASWKAKSVQRKYTQAFKFTPQKRKLNPEMWQRKWPTNLHNR